MKLLLLSAVATLLIGRAAQAQQATPGPLARFAVWQPKDNVGQQFASGYQQHLAWHARQPDPWNWYGWLVASGPRQGWFVDATFGHAATDFDHPVDPAGDAADNALHTEPFARFNGSFTVTLLPNAGTPGPLQLTAPYLRAYFLTPTYSAALQSLLPKLLAVAARKYPAQRLYCFEWLDGGKLPQLLLLLPFASFGESLVPAQLLGELEALDTRHVVQGVEAETWRYRADLSYFPAK
ncbi:hypothetical protein [Hymenobacter terrenus]|uniref:hypothetical protein n=1 Tax=Hymenobacter terrenus TaxID=1629124 RepID=UPI00061966C5|nr:hypothetical protein [Hymenobacter terrenus]